MWTDDKVGWLGPVFGMVVYLVCDTASDTTAEAHLLAYLMLLLTGEALQLTQRLAFRSTRPKLGYGGSRFGRCFSRGSG